ncbi:MAG: hypothetical protein CL675_02530 [Bdellovibrionaceae bacterium]|nr:hypothetical protein [Pseudobdellovibrionaceae bacterium]
MTNLVTIQRRGNFSFQEAQALAPIIKRITARYRDQVESLMKQLESVDLDRSEVIDRIEEQINGLIKDWHAKIRKLGAEPKGLWVVDFDCGEGYFCWKYPESSVSHWHSYDTSYKDRVLLDHLGRFFPELETEDQADFTKSEPRIK